MQALTRLLLVLAPMTLMIGPPGSGKTMMPKRLPTILPRLMLVESLQTIRIHSVAGELNAGVSAPGEQGGAANLDAVRGGEHVKRALTSAAAGGHNVLMIGPSVSGRLAYVESRSEHATVRVHLTVRLQGWAGGRKGGANGLHRAR